VKALRDRDADRAAELMADHLAKLHSYFAKVVRKAG
jgi:DNA-binding GntR family transcriptional regulator